MKKLQNNQAGIAHLLAIGLIVVFVAVGFIGWKVWDKNKTKNTTTSTVAPVDQKAISDTTKTAQTVDETASWTVFTSAKGWQVNVPDGWNLHTDMSSNGLTDYSTLTYKPGTKAVIEKTSAGRGGPFVLNVSTYVAGDPATENPAYLTEQTDFKAKNVEGKKYSAVLKEDIPMDGSKGDTIYRYVFVKNGKSVVVSSWQAQGSVSIIPQLEKALSTLEIK